MKWLYVIGATVLWIGSIVGKDVHLLILAFLLLIMAKLSQMDKAE